MRPQRQQPTRLPRPWDSPGKNTGVGCHFLLQCMTVKSESEVAQSCPTLSDPMDCSPPGSSVHGIFQARVLEWVAIAFILGSNSQNHTSELTPKELCSSFLRSLTSSELQDCGHCLEATRIKKLPLPQNRITLYHLQSEPAKWTHHPCFLTFTKIMTEQRHLW